MAKMIPTLKKQGLAQGTRSPRAEAIVADAIRLITEEGYGELNRRHPYLS